jgi:hypothetical protein
MSCAGRPVTSAPSQLTRPARGRERQRRREPAQRLAVQRVQALDHVGRGRAGAEAARLGGGLEELAGGPGLGLVLPEAGGVRHAGRVLAQGGLKLLLGRVEVSNAGKSGWTVMAPSTAGSLAHALVTVPPLPTTSGW